MEETIVRPKNSKNSKKEKQDSKPKRLPPYNVILLDDDDHTVEYVVDLCQKVFGYPSGKGIANCQGSSHHEAVHSLDGIVGVGGIEAGTNSFAGKR